MGFEQVHPLKLVEMCRAFDSIKKDDYGRPDQDEETRVFLILEDAAQECPACILSALRMSETFLYHNQFDYKESRDKFFSELNESRSRDYY